MRTISEHQAKVYEYAKGQGERWFTIQELSTEANVPDASAKNHATRFEEAGVFERMRISPSHVFRLSAAARRRNPELVKRLEAALPIFAIRRREWLAREAALLEPSNFTYQCQEEPMADGEATAVLTPSTSRPGEAASAPQQEHTRLGNAGRGRELRKPDQLLELLSRPGGASMDELVDHFGTQPHSIRALISVTTRERGLKSVLEDGRYRVRA